MSAFLGPIHYWLYNKIQKQQDITKEMTLMAEEKWGMDLDGQLLDHYGPAEKRPLEEVIDEANIHGWLQKQVSDAEYRLAYCVTEIIKGDASRLEVLKDLFNNKGKEMGRSLDKQITLAESYKVLTDSWLDGMPCDHAYEVVTENAIEFVFKRNTCVHTAYWKAVGGDIKSYYTLRNAWIVGFLEEQHTTLEKIDETTYKMIKEA